MSSNISLIINTPSEPSSTHPFIIASWYYG